MDVVGTSRSLLLFLSTIILLHSHMTKSTVEAVDNYVIQVPVFVDYRGFQNWKTVTGKTTEDELKAEINAMFVDINEVYKTLNLYTKNFTISFEVTDIQILSSNIYSATNIYAYQALDYFQNWLNRRGTKYDVSLLFTGSNLYDRNASPFAVGYANAGSICTAKSVATVELSGRYIDPLIAAHEIGHVLGAQHDQFHAETAACSSRDGYVMAPGLLIDKINHFTFSKCSFNMLEKALFTDKKGSCLNDGTANNVNGRRMGELMTPDAMCRRLRGKTSVVDRALYAKNDFKDESMCVMLQCVTTESEKYVATFQGMSCGENKQCIMGECVESTSEFQSNVTDTCPLGDQDGGLSKDKTCDDIYKEGGCSNFHLKCCGSCANEEISEADKFCLKKLSPASSSLVRNKYSKWGDEICDKLHCSTGFGYTFSYSSFDTPNGMPCGKGKECKDKKCVASTNPDFASLHDVCPFGDMPWIPGGYNSACSALVPKRYGCGTRFGDMCCGTCRDAK